MVGVIVTTGAAAAAFHTNNLSVHSIWYVAVDELAFGDGNIRCDLLPNTVPLTTILFSHYHIQSNCNGENAVVYFNRIAAAFAMILYGFNSA